MARNHLNAKSLVLTLVILAGLSLQSAQALEEGRGVETRAEVESTNLSPTAIHLSEVPEIQSLGAVQALSMPSFPTILHWVCKTLFTMVGVAVWIPSVKIVSGIVTVAAELTVRYFSLPTVACIWE